MKKISCIIPAYNEGPRIERVLEAARNTPHIDEIIVVDDGSADDTVARVRNIPNVTLIIHEKNRGKSVAIHTGIKAATGETLLFLDADLGGLTAANVTALIEPIASGVADVSISIRGNLWLWRIVGVDFLSGERVLPRKLLANSLDKIATLSSYSLEVFLNKLILQSKSRVAVVVWKNVISPFKSSKVGLWKGLRADILMIKHIFNEIPMRHAFTQIKSLRRLRV